MFGGADWIAWVVLGIALASCGGTCGLGWWGWRRWRRARRCGPARGYRLEARRGARTLPAASMPAPGHPRRKATPESRLKALQKQFVDGHLTVEQYERALDRLGPAG